MLLVTRCRPSSCTGCLGVWDEHCPMEGTTHSQHILIYFLAFLLSVRHCVRNSISCSSHWTYRHDFYVLTMACWFFVNQGRSSKVKIKNPWKYAFSGPILVTGAMCGTIQNRGGSDGVLLAACQLILATCQKFGNDRRPPLDRFPDVGKLPVWLASLFLPADEKYRKRRSTIETFIWNRKNMEMSRIRTPLIDAQVFCIEVSR